MAEIKYPVEMEKQVKDGKKVVETLSRRAHSPIHRVQLETEGFRVKTRKTGDDSNKSSGATDNTSAKKN